MDTKQVVWAYEKKFAAQLASHVLVKPKLSAWMIFIPFIFIFYFQDFSRYKKQRQEFLDNWLLSRKKALNEAEQALDEQRKPNTLAIAEQADLKGKATDKYHDLLTVMVNHYILLLTVKKDTYQALVRSGYKNRQGDFLFYVNQVTDAEKALNTALLPQLRKTSEGVEAIIKKIEKGCETLRRQAVKDIFAPSSPDK